MMCLPTSEGRCGASGGWKFAPGLGVVRGGAAPPAFPPSLLTGLGLGPYRVCPAWAILSLSCSAGSGPVPPQAGRHLSPPISSRPLPFPPVPSHPQQLGGGGGCPCTSPASLACHVGVGGGFPGHWGCPSGVARQVLPDTAVQGLAAPPEPGPDLVLTVARPWPVELGFREQPGSTCCPPTGPCHPPLVSFNQVPCPGGHGLV